jgi:hypothetical protein
MLDVDDVNTCVVYDGSAYCVDKDGKVYRFTELQQISYAVCPDRVLREFLKEAYNANKEDYT